MSSNAVFSGQPAVSQESLLHTYLVQLERNLQGWRGSSWRIAIRPTQSASANRLA